MTSWNDFNDADQQAGFDLIPKGTLLKLRMTIKPGGFDNPDHGWTGGWATESEQTGSVFLNAEFVVLEGPFAKRKLWSMIGLHSPKGDEWSNMGRAFIRAALNSSRGVQPNDTSANAQAARRIKHLGELDGLVFIGRVDIERDGRPDGRGEDRNVIKHAVEPDHKEYSRLMAGADTVSSPTFAGRSTSPSHSPTKPTGVTKPAWAQ